MISVLLPVYNGEKYLKECLSSILDQNFKKFELIIVDDCSSDDSLKVIKSFKDPRIKVFRNRTNLGLSASLNVGLKKCKHNIISRIDQDDVMFPNRLSEIYSIFLDYPEIYLVFSEAVIIDSKGVELYKFAMSVNSRKNKFKLIFINPFIHSSSSFRKVMPKRELSYIEDKSFSPPEDFELWSRLILLEEIKFHVIKKPLIKYRLLKDSYSRSNGNLIDNAIRIVLRNIVSLNCLPSKLLPYTPIVSRLYNKESIITTNTFNIFKMLYILNKKVNTNFYFSDILFLIHFSILIKVSTRFKELLKYMLRY